MGNLLTNANVNFHRNTTKKIMGSPDTLELISNHLFNNKIWADMTKISKGFEYLPIPYDTVNNMSILLPPEDHSWDELTFKLYNLCHADINSTAILISAPNAQVQLNSILT